MALGESYSPLTDEETKKQQETGPVQEAIKLLSLRMPHVQGAQAPAPTELLQGGGGGGGAAGGLSPDLLRRLLQQLAGLGGLGGFAPQQAPGGAPGLPSPPMEIPKPHVEYQPIPTTTEPWHTKEMREPQEPPRVPIATRRNFGG